MLFTSSYRKWEIWYEIKIHYGLFAWTPPIVLLGKHTSKSFLLTSSPCGTLPTNLKTRSTEINDVRQDIEREMASTCAPIYLKTKQKEWNEQSHNKTSLHTQLIIIDTFLNCLTHEIIFGVCTCHKIHPFSAPCLLVWCI